MPAAVVFIALAAALACGCDPPPRPAPDAGPRPSQPLDFDAAADYDPDWRPPPTQSAKPPPARPTLEAALATLPPGDGLEARVVTNVGTLQCVLLADRAPRAVAGFVWLANAVQAYDGTTIDRVIPDMLIAGARPTITPGWPPADERDAGVKHDRAGLLCDNGRDPKTSGELLITAGDASVLDRPDGPAFTIFGRCAPTSLIRRIAMLPADNARPQTPVTIERVRVVRSGVAPK